MSDAERVRAVTPSGVVLEYPLEYVFKIMGLAGDDFPEYARRLVARVVERAPAEKVSVRASSGGKYQSVSVEVVLRSEGERRAVYQLLHEDERVVYYL
jgi:putative lipoic acid-binding regulatory protein